MILLLQTFVLRRILQIYVVFILISRCAGGAVVERIERRKTSIAPLSITPSQDWNGNDGLWSTFALQIGTPPQSIQVHISTASSQILAVAPEGCTSGDPLSCPKLRGGVYTANLSSTYTKNTKNLTTNIYGLGLESQLGYTGRQYVGRFGFDSITLGIEGSNSPIIKNQTVGEIGVKGFWVGYFGLNPATTNFTDESSPLPSYLSNLRNESKIPSLSWGYTAGNQYRLGEVLGSLTLGGYDKARFVENAVSFNVSRSDYGYLGVILNSVTSGTSNLLPNEPITMFLDSTLPYIYLPAAACALFENVFGLTYNATANLYTVNTTQHILLQSSNPSLTFTLGIPNSTDTSTIAIELPYAAFDLTASYPLLPDDSKLFPLRRATDESQYILGRTFFQEAYVIMDWERGQFSVSQCRWDVSTKVSSIVTIGPLEEPSLKGAFGIGGIAGIAAAGGIIIIALGIWCLWWRPRKKREERRAFELGTTEPAVAGAHIDPFAKPELDGGEVRHGAVVHEADHSAKIQHYEMQGSERLGTVYEMPVNEEVAYEMAHWDEQQAPRELASERENRRSGAAGWSWGGLLGLGRPKRSNSESTTLSSGWGSRQQTPRGAYVSLVHRGQEGEGQVSPGHDSGYEGTGTLGTATISSAYQTPLSDPRSERGSRQPSLANRDREVGERGHHTPEPGMGTGEGTLSSMSSGWGTQGSGAGSSRSFSDIVSPESPPSAGRGGPSDRRGGFGRLG